jgi:hypothetical protein
MPKYTVKTTVVYEFEVEADDYVKAVVEGYSFDKYQWLMDIEDVEATLVEEK